MIDHLHSELPSHKNLYFISLKTFNDDDNPYKDHPFCLSQKVEVFEIGYFPKLKKVMFYVLI